MFGASTAYDSWIYATPGNEQPDRTSFLMGFDVFGRQHTGYREAMRASPRKLSLPAQPDSQTAKFFILHTVRHDHDIPRPTGIFWIQIEHGQPGRNKAALPQAGSVPSAIQGLKGRFAILSKLEGNDGLRAAQQCNTSQVEPKAEAKNCRCSRRNRDWHVDDEHQACRTQMRGTQHLRKPCRRRQGDFQQDGWAARLPEISLLRPRAA